MIYQRKYMSITEMVKATGLSRDFIKGIARTKGAPIVRTSAGRKIYFKTEEFDDFVKKLDERRK